MPFKSEKQRRYLFANEPEIARDWTETYGSKIQKADGGIMRVPFKVGEEWMLPNQIFHLHQQDRQDHQDHQDQIEVRVKNE